MPRCLLALGSNLGDRHAILERVCAEIADLRDCRLLARSPWLATVPIGGTTGQGEFLNGALLLETTLPPRELTTNLLTIETRLGRRRVVRWDARVIDIDLLLYDTTIMETPELTIPHPRMAVRRFVLEPAVAIAGAMLHPTAGWTLRALLDHLRTAARHVAVTAAQPPIAAWLAAQLQQVLGCPIALHAGGNFHDGSVSQAESRVQFPEHRSGQPPVVTTWQAETLATEVRKKSHASTAPRPAVVLAIDPKNPREVREAVRAAGFTAEDSTTAERSRWNDCRGWGPLARITADDPATVLQEAVAAVRCVWPELEKVSDEPAQ